jgi:hypothetical protein
LSRRHDQNPSIAIDESEIESGSSLVRAGGEVVNKVATVSSCGSTNRSAIETMTRERLKAIA